MGMTKEHFLEAEMIVISGLLEHVRDFREGTIFEGNDNLDRLLDALVRGCDITASRMKILNSNQEQTCDC